MAYHTLTNFIWLTCIRMDWLAFLSIESRRDETWRNCNLLTTVFRHIQLLEHMQNLRINQLATEYTHTNIHNHNTIESGAGDQMFSLDGPPNYWVRATQKCFFFFFDSCPLLLRRVCALFGFWLWECGMWGHFVCVCECSPTRTRVEWATQLNRMMFVYPVTFFFCFFSIELTMKRCSCNVMCPI